MEKLVIYTDGGSRGNPGPAAIGAVIQDTRYKIQGFREYAEYIGEATNNVAEYRAVIFALKKTKHLIGKKRAEKAAIEVRLDSELVAKQLQGKYKILEHELQPLFIELWNLQQDFGKVTFTAIPREENRQADKLVNQALDGNGMKSLF